MKSSSIIILKSAIIIFIIALFSKVSGQEISHSGYVDTLQFKSKQYFSNPNYGAQLENYMGTRSISFDFPGKSAKQLYNACLKLFRGYTEKIEFIENRIIDSYYIKKVEYSDPIGAVIPVLIYLYNYMVICDDEKITIENPHIATLYTDINAKTGEVLKDYISVASYISLLQEFSSKDKGGKLKEKRDELRALLSSNVKNGYQELSNQLNHFTDSLLTSINNGIELDSLEWISDAYAPVFTLSIEGLKASNNRNYMVIKTPEKNSDQIKNKTKALVNFIHMDEPIEYYRSIINDRYEFYERRDIPAYVVDSYFDRGIINFSNIYLKNDFSNFQKFVVKKTILATDNEYGDANFEFEISYAPGLVKISTPKISKIEDGIYDWMNKENTYRSIFSTPDNKVLQPVWKKAVETYFNELFYFLFRYYSQD
ncbi:MAG: hypothetical protein KA467_00740 [Bacteroidales bacterium]|jgi:hypothetical protein|nr:hypothetical protein [Bacteroidales bacterium]